MSDLSILNIKNIPVSEYKYVDLYKQRCPNGSITILQFEIDGQIPEFPHDHHFFLKDLMTEDTLKKAFKALGIQFNNDEINYKKAEYRTDSFRLIADLAQKLFLGGCYYSTLIALDKYKGENINPNEAFRITLDFISSLITPNFDDLRSFSIFGISWNDWFDLEYMDYLSDSFIIIHPQGNTITFVLFKDSD